MLFMFLVPILLTLLPTAAYQGILAMGKKTSAPAHYLWTYILLLYVWLVFSVTGIGSVWDIFAKGGLTSALSQSHISLVPFQSADFFTSLMNILMFMPFGFLLPYIWKNFRNPLKTAFAGFLFSAFLELAQLPTNRATDVDDLIMNTLGALFGYGVWKLIGRYFFNRKEKQRTLSLGNCEPVICLVLACLCNFLLYNWRWFL